MNTALTRQSRTRTRTRTRTGVKGVKQDLKQPQIKEALDKAAAKSVSTKDSRSKPQENEATSYILLKIVEFREGRTRM